MHRDIKPANILLHDDLKRTNPPPKALTLKLADFGFAKTFKDGYKAANMSHVGTEAYMAPEVLLDEPNDEGTDLFSADLFSVGIVLCECLTKSRPFTKVSERNAHRARFAV